MFVDQVKVRVRAGNGGDGCVSFHREKFVPRGGPDGGAGGNGGNGILYVDPGETTLVRLHGQPLYEAGDGSPGEPNNRTGKSGADIRIPVAPGSLIKDSATGEFVCDLVNYDDEAVVAKGGKGGKGNSSFATPTVQVPRKYESGKPGDDRELLVELKIVADIGLVGFPNAGKSTLLNALTRARAKIASYPFTTLNPVLGTIELEVDEEATLVDLQVQMGIPAKHRPRIVIADIPGIVEGAHGGVGLGTEFLRHIERTEVLVFVLDVSIHREQEPEEAYRALLEEVRNYNEELLEHPRLICLNKIDDPLELEEIDQIEQEVRGVMQSESPAPVPGDVFRISGLKEMGLDPLRSALVRLVTESRRERIR
ncbi:MAG: GTPase Obg [Candidatus Omnitrophica bacterium]|nr:GTPase Obg [Candidatus Omnitrophota bacterium]